LHDRRREHGKFAGRGLVRIAFDGAIVLHNQVTKGRQLGAPPAEPPVLCLDHGRLKKAIELINQQAVCELSHTREA
jgi:hypothetical protein